MTLDPGDPEPEAPPPDAIAVAEPRSAYLGGDVALSPSEANGVTAESDAVVVIVAGEASSGKSTLILQLFAQFLRAPFGGWSFAGSRTLRRLDVMHRDLRLASGNSVGQVERTQAEDMRLLHLELATRSRRMGLLLSDVRGEYFETLTDGADVRTAAPLAARADLCIVTIDGARLSDLGDRRHAIWRARQLLGALTEPGGLRRGTPTLIAVSKSDKFGPHDLAGILEEVKGDLQDVAVARGLVPTVVAVSALPDGGGKPYNLKTVLDWLTAHRPTAPAPYVGDRRSGRVSWRAEVAG